MSCLRHVLFNMSLIENLKKKFMPINELIRNLLEMLNFDTYHHAKKYVSNTRASCIRNYAHFKVN